ncbi:MAG: hypothetical protein PVJ69_01205, partial [Desulfobacteraceae bacterium]
EFPKFRVSLNIILLARNDSFVELRHSFGWVKLSLPRTCYGGGSGALYFQPPPPASPERAHARDGGQALPLPSREGYLMAGLKAASRGFKQ